MSAPGAERSQMEQLRELQNRSMELRRHLTQVRGEGPCGGGGASWMGGAQSVVVIALAYGGLRYALARGEGLALGGKRGGGGAR